MSPNQAASTRPEAFYELVSARRGHFRLESGLHSALWLDLDSLFADARLVEPFVASLADALRRHEPEIVCGPMAGGALLAQSIADRIGAEYSFAEKSADGDGLFQARYRVPAALAARASDRRVAIVDDVISAGSSVRATYAELTAAGARVVAAGALLVLGERGAEFFAEKGIPLERVLQEPFETWEPARCPLCARGLPLKTVGR